jgi:hypothetical protein
MDIYAALAMYPPSLDEGTDGYVAWMMRLGANVAGRLLGFRREGQDADAQPTG